MSINTSHPGAAPRLPRLLAVWQPPHDLEVLLGAQDHAEAGADELLVAASTIRTIRPPRAAAAHAASSRPRRGARPGGRCRQRDALAHPDQPVPRPGSVGAGVAGAPGTGHGLVGMRERVALYGGDLQAGRLGAGGWTLRARLPLGAA